MTTWTPLSKGPPAAPCSVVVTRRWTQGGRIMNCREDARWDGERFVRRVFSGVPFDIEGVVAYIEIPPAYEGEP